MDFNNFYNGQEFETYKYLGAFVHMNGVLLERMRQQHLMWL